MSNQQKLSPLETEITRLKRLWRDSFTEAERDYWREQLFSSRTLADLRRELREKLNINLQHDVQLLRFRKYDARLIALEEENQKSAADQAELEAQGLTGEKLRHALIERMKARAYNEGDFKLALKAITADVKVETLQLGREKFNLASHTKIEAGLDALAVHIKNNPAARAAYDAFRNIIKQATA